MSAPKGYLESVESRLHRLEAFLGTLIASDDPRAQSLLSELVTDQEARNLLSADFQSAATGPSRHSWASSVTDQPTAGSSSRPRKALGFDLSGAKAAIEPSWIPIDSSAPRSTTQAVAASETVPRPRTSQPQKQRRTDPSVPRAETGLSTSLFSFQALPPDVASHSVAHTNFRLTSPPPDEAPEEGPEDEVADVLGQLSLNETTRSIRYHGRSRCALFLLTLADSVQWAVCVRAIYTLDLHKADMIADDSRRFRKPCGSITVCEADRSTVTGRSPPSATRIKRLDPMTTSCDQLASQAGCRIERRKRCCWPHTGAGFIRASPSCTEAPSYSSSVAALSRRVKRPCDRHPTACPPFCSSPSSPSPLATAITMR